MFSNFIQRTISTKYEARTNEGDIVTITASRMRNNNNVDTISINIGQQLINFENEHMARTFADALLEICDNPCELPILNAND